MKSRALFAAFFSLVAALGVLALRGAFSVESVAISPRAAEGPMRPNNGAELLDAPGAASRVQRAPSSSSPVDEAVDEPDLVAFKDLVFAQGSPSQSIEPWLLRLRVVGPALPLEDLAANTGDGAAELVQVRIRARMDGAVFADGEVITASCKVGELTEIDIGLLAAGSSTPAALLVYAEHPLLVAPPLPVPLEPFMYRSGVGRSPVDATLIVSVPMRVEGVVSPPLRGQIGLWAMEHGAPRGRMINQTTCTVDGTYSLEIKRPGRYLLVAAHSARLPAHCVFEVTPDEPVHLADTLTLELGAEFEGAFTVGGARPPMQVSFTLEREVEGIPLSFGYQFGADRPGEPVWVRGGVERRTVEAHTTVDGVFRLRGLEPGAHILRIHGFNVGHNRSTRPPLSVQVPAKGLRFDLGVSLVKVTLKPQDGSGPPPLGDLHIERSGKDAEQIRCKDGLLWGSPFAVFSFDAGETILLRYEAPGAASVERTVTCPPPGEQLEVELNLPPMGQTGSLRIELVGDVPKSGTSFVVHSQRIEDSSRAFGTINDDEASIVLLEDGHLAVAEIPAGRARVSLYPATWVGHRGSHHLDATFEVDITPDGTAEARVPLEIGARLRISKKGANGALQSAQCTVAQEDGTKIPVTFIAYADNGGGAAASYGSLLDLAPSLVMPNLKPGDYTVTVNGEARLVQLVAGTIHNVVFE